MKTGFEVSRTVLFGLLVVLAQMTDRTAAELKILAPRAIWTVLNEIGSQFEATSGYKLNVITDITATFAKRIDDGESFDIFIGPPAQMDRLIENNRIVANTRTAIARSGIGVEVRTGASKPDISSVDAFKRALLNAKSIGYLKEGASGVYLAGLLDRLGIAEAKIQSDAPGNRYSLRACRQWKNRIG